MSVWADVWLFFFFSLVILSHGLFLEEYFSDSKWWSCSATEIESVRV